jgi:shikimate kinase
VLVIGMMGSGKSTVGRLVAERVGWPYLDNDDLVERAHGTTARELLAERGDDALREAEGDALELGVTTAAPVVIGVAAGTVLDAARRDLMREGGIVVWLHADAAILESRAMRGEHRPWLDRHGASWIRDTAADREPLYASVADFKIDTGINSPEAAATQVIELLETVGACRPALRSDRRVP